jgi:hypothetical protein
MFKSTLILLAFALVFLATACTAGENDTLVKHNELPRPSMIGPPPNTVLTSPMVLSGFNEGWEGEPIQIKGTYMTVRLTHDAEGAIGHVNVYSDTSFVERFAHCEFRGPALDSIKTLIQQDELRISGRVDSTFQNLVRIVDCRLEDV